MMGEAAHGVGVVLDVVTRGVEGPWDAVIVGVGGGLIVLAVFVSFLLGDEAQGMVVFLLMGTVIAGVLWASLVRQVGAPSPLLVSVESYEPMGVQEAAKALRDAYDVDVPPTYVEQIMALREGDGYAGCQLKSSGPCPARGEAFVAPATRGDALVQCAVWPLKQEPYTVALDCTPRR